MSLPIWLSFVLLISGMTLVLFGVRGRLIASDTPHCRRCRYNLTGQTSQHCPECGTEMSRRTIVWRLRRRSPAACIIGLLLVVTAASSFYVASLGVTWIRRVPTGVLLQLASRSNQTSLTELRRRYKSNLLDKAEKSKLIDASIRTAKLNTGWRTAESILVIAREANELSAPQLNDYYALLTSEAHAEFHRRVKQGEAFLVNVSAENGALISNRDRVVVKIRLLVGDTEYIDFGGIGRNPSVFWLNETPPGFYTGSVEVTLDVMPPKFAPQPLFTKQHKIPLKLEVVSKDTKTDVRLQQDPKQAAAICKRMWLYPDHWIFQRMNITPYRPGPINVSDLELRYSAPSNLSLAFRAIVRTEAGKETDVGYWYHKKGSQHGQGEISIDWNAVGDKPIRLILRSDPEIAQKAIDLGTILETEIESTPFEEPYRGGNKRERTGPIEFSPVDRDSANPNKGLEDAALDGKRE